MSLIKSANNDMACDNCVCHCSFKKNEVWKMEIHKLDQSSIKRTSLCKCMAFSKKATVVNEEKPDEDIVIVSSSQISRSVPRTVL